MFVGCTVCGAALKGGAVLPTAEQRQATDRYIRGIRNQTKRAYAVAYLAYVIDGARAPKDSSYALGSMAMQAVRITLHDIYR